MKHITFYLDFISPYAYLAFEKLPEALLGHSYSVTYKPVLLAALLKHHGQLGPAEIAPKRDWIYRQVLWLAKQHGVELQLPASHPLHPGALRRLAIAGNARGLNGWLAGNCSSTPCCLASHSTWRKTQSRLRAISAGPSCPRCLSSAPN